MDRLIRVCVAIVLACISTSALAETCIASHYGYSYGRTASGERMNPSAMTAAHRSKPFGSQVTVTSQKSGRSVTVRINDRARSSRAAVSTYPQARRMRSGWLALKKFRSTEHRGFGCVV
jgi:rare lipoprotein A